MTERVLVLPRSAVPGGCDFHGIRPADEAALVALRTAVAAHGRYLERPVAEEDPDHKQLIPYVLVRDRQRVFLMERTDAGGDRRLHGKASIGVGGHLNPVDDGEDALMAGLRREWAEELVTDWTPDFGLVGMLNDDSNPVGAVHLGVVFAVEADGRDGRGPRARQAHGSLRGAGSGAGGVGSARDLVAARRRRDRSGQSAWSLSGRPAPAPIYSIHVPSWARRAEPGARNPGPRRSGCCRWRGDRAHRADRRHRPGQRRLHRGGASRLRRGRERGRADRHRLARRRADEHGPHHQGDPRQRRAGHRLGGAGGRPGGLRGDLRHARGEP